eukprot:CAMPEP_0172532302 /NCGR_PEP_ID=MMETSP1067-20121228/5409_1 /TAXON_ID=265564 ORGANISM="Thalassiosira punctigera, Strain Tpunct2005C2" /NCGR_SAMPLE_ID=MMETSP1067 /ASSEMBLY_ACC=CAM_ASM_000444 /LENGTH=189 /DNA_ID=CAMNT_0013316807 /DNA_START=132 /DNA_END=698 /DNA_ORIENTATION=-
MLSANFRSPNPRVSNNASRSRSRYNSKNKRRVHFTDTAARRHEYEFDWDLRSDYWYDRTELNSFSAVRFEEAATLREARGVSVSSRDDADGLTMSRRNLFVGDKITNALDDVDDNHEVSIRGIEHFVFPLLQKEMIARKKELKAAVLGYSRDPKARRLDPRGERLARESAVRSKWARDVAKERGIKYCQ